MIRLIQRGLMYGNLFHVASPALVERYNRALEHLTGKRTGLTDFYVDISGFSPEVGNELSDPLYLNHNGVNRQFILLSTEQRKCPLLDAKFSTSHGILKRFITENEAALFALTARDAVAGELVNSVYDISHPARLFDIRAITVEADTTRGAVRDAATLATKVDTFLNADDAWFDDVLIGEMIQLAGQTGDVTRNPVRLDPLRVQKGNFWTAHFGGLYIFQTLDHPATIAATQKPDGVPTKYTFDLSERNRIAKFLEFNDLAEPVVKARGVDGAAILRQKMDFILIDAVTGAGVDLAGTTRRDMRMLARHHAHLLPEAFHGLADLVNWAENGGPWPRISSEHPAYFYTLRAADTADVDLVNMLLAELCPRDVRQLFICHKQAFYAAYATWPETKKEYVAQYLEAEYKADKAGARAALFGHDAPMEQPAPPPRDMIQRVGPWGAVRRR
ncbi:DUF6638 family protein [uncultured Tateyamaria sp.]|uniref:DUF6638 family protein n=1 Tax=uncultured Tateyamaria sp. TaxID=455651 RepID=UPI0026238EED|nr:DUF6638 family protein [uncultured Tateyamaria sp.]